LKDGRRVSGSGQTIDRKRSFGQIEGAPYDDAFVGRVVVMYSSNLRLGLAMLTGVAVETLRSLQCA
jgi:hypothetical protein